MFNMFGNGVGAKDLKTIRKEIEEQRVEMSESVEKHIDIIDDSWGTLTGNLAMSPNATWAVNGAGTHAKFDELEVAGHDIKKMAKDMELLKERFLILEADFEKHEKYPALKAAYEQYKLIEALLKED